MKRRNSNEKNEACGGMPTITEHGKYHALTMHSIDTKETAIKCWNYRSDEKEATK